MPRAAGRLGLGLRHGRAKLLGRPETNRCLRMPLVAALLVLLFLFLLRLPVVVAAGVALARATAIRMARLRGTLLHLRAFAGGVVISPETAERAQHAFGFEVEGAAGEAGRCAGVGLQKPQHLLLQEEHLALGGPWVRPSTLPLLPVVVETISLLVCVLAPLGDVFVHLGVQLFHLVLEEDQPLLPFLGRECRVPERRDGLVSFAVDMLHRVRP
mmetsp:Transcript_112880/g.221348  ORF Transcript_112880/g.221348 Transcript_112880/m.221348 type:complete len:214 (+) Transcript_112880:667-1308(+)